MCFFEVFSLSWIKNLDVFLLILHIILPVAEIIQTILVHFREVLLFTGKGEARREGEGDGERGGKRGGREDRRGKGGAREREREREKVC